MTQHLQSVGMIEFNSIATGIQAADHMAKAAVVEPLMLKTICPGKFVVAVHGEIASVSAAVDAGLTWSEDTVVDHFVIPSINPDVVTALSGTLKDGKGSALGVIETFSAASAIVAADTASKAADIRVAEVRVAMGLGGKGLCILSGDVAAVEMAVSAGSSAASESGLLVAKVVIPSISPEILEHVL